MKRSLSILLLLHFSCTKPPVKPVDSISDPDIIQWHNSDYTVWKFLEKHPSEKLVIETLGPADSVWIDEKMEFKVLYYFIQNLQDYNTVEINLTTGNTTGFEWD